jgi:hypothetical protein
MVWPEANFILDATRNGPQKDLAAVISVTRSGELEPLQATGGWTISPVGATE